MSIPKNEASYWIESTPQNTYPHLHGGAQVDVAVIGAGIAGLASAYYLKKAGYTVAVIDRGIVGGRVTGNTTGKLTSQHNLCYDSFIQTFGEEKSRIYGEANQDAIASIEQIIADEHIGCDFEHDDNYVITEDTNAVAKFKAEAEAAKKLGLPAEFTTTCDLPFAIAGAVKFSGQAKFHARKFLLGLAKAVDGNGSYVYEHTEAFFAHDGGPSVVRTPHGNIRCKDIIIATNVPFPPFTHTYYGGYEYPLKSYIVAGKLTAPFKGMYITESQRHMRSILPFKLQGEDWLLVGGESRFPGFSIGKNRHQVLADYARERFGIAEIAYRWSTWDYISNDQMPLIGKLLPWSKRVYVATGFNKWGLTTGVIAGKILTDAIAGNASAWAQTFDSTRLSPVMSLPKAAMRIISKL
jgi:glycine/D-amino acid oxidase-like deaminating enzyme